MIVRIPIFLAIVILAGTGGELLVAHAMRQAARVAFGLGIALQAVAFFALLALLSWADLSFVVPATALNYVVGAAGSALFLHEHVDRTRWAGVLLVCLGVAVMCASEL